MNHRTAATVLVAAFLTPLASARGCSTFTPLGGTESKSFTEPEDALRVSDVINCSTDSPAYDAAIRDCRLDAEAYASYGPRFNVTWPTDDGEADKTSVDAFLTAANIDVDRAMIYGVVMDQTYLIPEGESAYIDFYETYTCWTGTYSDCDDGSLAEGTVAEACAPVYNTGSGTTPMFYEEYELVRVTTDPETAAELGPNPNAEQPEGFEVRFSEYMANDLQAPSNLPGNSTTPIANPDVGNGTTIEPLPYDGGAAGHHVGLWAVGSVALLVASYMV